MTKRNTATWRRNKTGKWQLLVHFQRYWTSPEPGTGLGSIHWVWVTKQGRPPVSSQVELTSRVFDRDGQRLAYAEALS